MAHLWLGQTSLNTSYRNLQSVKSPGRLLGRMMNMAKKKKSKYSLVPVGYAHYLRGGAGPHKDRKKELSKMKCRRRVDGDS